MQMTWEWMVSYIYMFCLWFSMMCVCGVCVLGKAKREGGIIYTIFHMNPYIIARYPTFGWDSVCEKEGGGNGME